METDAQPPETPVPPPEKKKILIVDDDAGQRSLNVPEGRAFWREQDRIRLLPSRLDSAGGIPISVTRIESVSGASMLRWATYD